MKKRIISMLLVLVMAMGVIPIAAFYASAATTLGSTPNPKVEYSYSTDVSCGTIRYIAQNTGSNYFNWNYWPSGTFGGYSSPSTECGTACISMALSYVGVDRTPKVLLEATNGYTSSMWGTQGNATSRSVSISTSGISSAMDDYISGDGKYSPLCVYIVPFSATSDMHWVLLVGKISENKYLALNPWHTNGSDGTFTIQINGSTATYNGTTNPITSVNQWYNAGAVSESSRPGKPVLKYELENNTVTFTWADTANTTHYNLWLHKKNAAGEWEKYEYIFYAESGVSRTFEGGEYRAQLLAYDSETWESDGSDWVHTWADDVFFAVEGDKTITYYAADGSVMETATARRGQAYTLTTQIPQKTGSYFSGWSYSQNAANFDIRPGETMTVSGNVKLYPVYVTHEQAISGRIVYIYDIADVDMTGYTYEEVQGTVQTTVPNSYWTDWSDYSTTPVTAGDGVEVRTATMYRYYYFLCPSCGTHEPFSGKSDCGATITGDAYHCDWFTVPYSQSDYETFSYTTSKYYTTSLGDGEVWCFSSGNLNDTAPGTTDASSSDEVITTGYSSRTYVEEQETVNRTVTGYRLKPKETPKPTLESIQIATQPAKISYEIGESFDATGLTLKATYSDGSQKTVTSGFTFSGFSSATAGSKTVTVTYEGKTATFAVTVQEPEAPEIPADAPQIIVGQKKAVAGDTVTVDIALKNNPGIASMKLKVSYSNLLTLTNVTYNSAIGGQFQQPQKLTSPVTLNWFNGLANSTGDWVFATLTFTVSDQAQGGEMADITVTYNADDVYNIAEDNVKFYAVNGGVEIRSYIPGDINGDGSVNNKDVTRLFQYLSDYEVEVVEAALDVNGDGSINNKDLTRLFQYLSDWDVEIH